MPNDVERIARQAARPAIVRLWEALLPLKSVVSFMNTGAHPDDETSALLAVLARRDGVRVSYVCANRGEGGQNAIGTESQSDLGALRSREMEEAARVLDFALYWLSETPDDAIFDFGFSKSAEETFSRWGVERTLERLVRVIRTERPDILCPTFLDVPGQHGHHRAMTRAAIRALELAADGDAFPEQIEAGLKPWQVAKFYLPAWSGAGDAYDDTEPPPNATVSVEAGTRDPVFGATYAQMAQWSRVLHRTQGMGRWVDAGPKPIPLHRLFAVAGLPETETSILDGLPRTVGDLAALCKDRTASDALSAAQRHIDASFERFPDNEAVLAEVVAALQQIRLAAGRIGAEADALSHRLSLKHKQLTRAAAVAAGLEARLVFTPSIIAPGGKADAELSATFANATPEGDARLTLAVPPDWQAEPWEQTRTENGSTATFAVDAPEDAPADAGYRASFSSLEANAETFGTVAWQVHGTDIETVVEAEAPLAVLPPVGLSVRPQAVIYNLAAPPDSVPITIEARRWAGHGRDTTIALEVPADWQVSPESQDLTLEQVGSVAEARFAVTPPKKTDTTRFDIPVGATGMLAGTRDIACVDHAHIGRTFLQRPARLVIQSARVELPDGARVGYVDGGGDRVADRLSQAGLDVTSLDAATLAHGDLSGFDTIVIGIFAYRTRPDLAAANDRIKQFVHGGGHLLTLYHRPMDNWDPGQTPPRPVRIGTPSLRWRVTDQNAEVTHLVPDHPLLNRPNRIGGNDWDGWHKERGLYFASEWDPVYEPLLEMADPDEAPLKGALISGRIGLGRHTHTSLILHHQLDQLVPGAYRLMANLVVPVEKG